MPQYLKEEIQAAIARSALRVFARKGFLSATMAEIARGAGISTGNIYRYYEGKEVLFQALLPDDFAQALLGLLRRRVEALAGIEDLRQLPPTASFHLASEELLRFAIENRLRVVILLGRCEGTKYEGFAEEVVRGLVGSAIEHFRALRPGLRLRRPARLTLEQLYRNLLLTLVHLLAELEDAAEIRQAVDGLSRYHLSGLKAFFEP
jgi:AcrR family transcriptional regulator